MRDQHGDLRGVGRGGKYPPEYMCWKSLKQRCKNPNNPGYRHYGGRGIQVCEKWNRSYVAFLGDVGRRPSPRHTLDRINNDGHYEPGNVRWATWSEQRRNKRPCPPTRVQKPYWMKYTWHNRKGGPVEYKLVIPKWMPEKFTINPYPI